MAAKNAKRPRPNKNSDGQDKRPSMTHDIHIKPGEAPQPPAPPGAPPAGATNPMTHPAAPAMASSLGNIQPPPTQNNRQVQERITFKDLDPALKSQVAQQQGLDPYAAVKQAQDSVNGALSQPTGGPIPNQLSGPFIPPELSSFPDDMAHLSRLIGQGYAPGASAQEHEYGMNADAMARAKLNAAFAGAQNEAPPTPPAPPMPPTAPAPAQPAPGMPAAAGPQMQSGMVPPPPPELVAEMLRRARAKR